MSQSEHLLAAVITFCFSPSVSFLHLFLSFCSTGRFIRKLKGFMGSQGNLSTRPSVFLVFACGCHLVF